MWPVRHNVTNKTMKRTALFLALAMLATGMGHAAVPKQIKVKPIGKEIEVRDFAAAYARLYVNQEYACSYLSDAISFAETGKYEITAAPYDPDECEINYFNYKPPYLLDLGSSDIDGHEIVRFRGWPMDNGHTLFGAQEMAGQDCNTYIKFYEYDPATGTFTLDEQHAKFLEREFGHEYSQDADGKPIVCLHRISLEVDGLYLYEADDFMNTGKHRLLRWDGKGFVVQITSSH